MIKYETINLAPLIIVTLIITVFALISHYNNLLVKNNLKIHKNKFGENKIYNWFYILSFQVPFKWFVEDDEHLTDKGKEILADLNLTRLDERFTVRSWMATKTFVMFGMILLAYFFSIIKGNGQIIAQVLLNIGEESTISNFTFKTFNIVIFGFFLLLSLYPNLYLRQKKKSMIFTNTKDIPVLQIFIILMLKSHKTVSDILLGLSKIDTPHSHVFEVGYRKFVRNKADGIRYLKKQFEGNKFEESFVLLEELEEYSRKDTITIMQSNLNTITEHAQDIKMKNAGTRLLYSQASMIIPFSAIILLGAVPLIIFGMSNFAMGGF